MGIFLMISLAMAVMITVNGCQQTNMAQQGVAGEMTRENDNLKKATFAGGCFWCTEAVFNLVKGVDKVEPGYSGGKLEDPTYEQVSTRQLVMQKSSK
jgi:hypothetical protein